MECLKVRDNISGYIDGELDDIAAAEISRHLGGCSSCRAEHEKLKRGWDALDAWQDSKPPEELKRRTLRASSPYNRFFGAKVMASLAASLLLVIGMALYYGSSGRMSGDRPHDQSVAIRDINEDELIANLDMLEDDDFYDALDELVRLDILLLLDDSSMNRQKESISS